MFFLYFGSDKLAKRCFRLKIGHFYKGWGFVYMYEKENDLFIITFILISHCNACLELFQLATDCPYTIVLKKNDTFLLTGQTEPKLA